MLFLGGNSVGLRAVCCDVCGRVWCWFVGIECVLCVGEFGVVLWGVCLCCVWEIMVWVCVE